MRKYIIFILGVFFSLNVYSQILKGEVYISDSEYVIYKVTVEGDLSKTKLSGTFSTPKFEIPMDSTGTFNVIITADGCTPVEKQIYISNNSENNIGNVILKRSMSVNLKEVTVTAKRVQIQRDGMNYTIRNIQGTHLGDAGNLMDMLKWTPGIIVKMDEDISVIGKGTPVIYVNDRKIADKSELLGLQSTDVNRIEIIRDPGARYSTNTNSVIKIYLRRPLKDFLGASVNNSTSFMRKISNSTRINLNGKAGIVTGNLSFTYNRRNTLSYSQQNTNIIHNEGNSYNDFSDSKNITQSNIYNIFSGLNFLISPKSLLTVQYSGNIQDKKPDFYSRHEIEDGGEIISKFDTTKTINNNFDLHTVSASYTLTRNKNSVFSVIGDFSTKSLANESSIIEFNETKNHKEYTGTSSTDLYRIYSLNSEYSFKIGEKDEELIGADFGHINSNTHMNINDVLQFTKRRNTWLAVFGSFKRSWGKLGLNLGLRYEYDYTNLKSDENQSKTYSDIFPNARLSYKVSNSCSYSLTYRRGISRPSMSRLSPVINYIDSLHYTTGNPNLKPVFYDKISISANISDLTISASYTHRKNPIISVTLHEENSNVMIYKPINIAHSNSFSIEANYSYSNDYLDFWVFGGIDGDFMEYPYLGNITSFNKISGYISADFSYKFCKTFEFYANIFYQSPWMDGNREVGYNLDANIGVSANFFQKKLYVGIEGMDLFAKCVTPYYQTHYLDISEWRKNQYDGRGVKITLRYTINSIKTNFRQKSGNEQLLQRTY